MRWCFYVGSEYCPRKVCEDFKSIFVVMPFKQPYEDEYIFAIKEPLENLGFDVVKGTSSDFN